MTLNFYTLGVIYIVYSFLGWVAETVVATIRGGRFANRGAAAGPFCFIYGTTGVLLAVSFGDLRTEPVYLFFACALAATIIFPAIHMEALSINPASVKQLIVTYVQNLFGRFGLFAIIYGAVAVILLALTITARSRMKRRQNI